MSFRAFPEITPNEPWSRIVAIIVQWTRRGKLNCVEEVTLSAATSTTLNDQLIGPDSVVHLTAKDANAAALTGVYVDTYAYGSCVIHHSLAAGTEVFRYSVIG